MTAASAKAYAVLLLVLAPTRGGVNPAVAAAITTTTPAAVLPVPCASPSVS